MWADQASGVVLDSRHGCTCDTKSFCLKQSESKSRCRSPYVGNEITVTYAMLDPHPTELALRGNTAAFY